MLVLLSCFRCLKRAWGDRKMSKYWKAYRHKKRRKMPFFSTILPEKIEKKHKKRPFFSNFFALKENHSTNFPPVFGAIGKWVIFPKNRAPRSFLKTKFSVKNALFWGKKWCKIYLIILPINFGPFFTKKNPLFSSNFSKATGKWVTFWDCKYQKKAVF